MDSTKRKFSKQNPHTFDDLFSRDDWNFAGIADAHGIESMKPRDKVNNQQLMFWNLRAESNRQRHATVYFANLDKATEAIVKKLMKKNDCEGALKIIKTLSDNVLMTNHISWQMIPDPDLDPWAHAN